MTLTVARTQFGEAEVIQVVETDIGPFMAGLLPDATPENVGRIGWLGAPYRNADGSLNAVSQCFVIRKGARQFVVDTCVGNEKDVPGIPAFTDMHLGFLDALTQAGIDPAQVTDVLCTHLHFDHVGWNTYRRDGQWHPTFPNARYHFARTELEHWQRCASGEQVPSPAALDAVQAAAWRQSVQPVVAAGLVNLIAADEDLGDGFSVFPSPGHSVGHVCLRVDAGAAVLVLAGDVMHHPCQIAHPEWASTTDHDSAQSTATRRRVFGELAGTEVWMTGTHFPSPSFGRISRAPSGAFAFASGPRARINAEQE